MLTSPLSSPIWTMAAERSVFGGCLIGQAIAAAQETVPAGFDVHMVQCNFQAPGDPRRPIAYGVERVGDGRSFVTRLVRATQGGEGEAGTPPPPALFLATVSFQRGEPDGGAQLRYAPPPPPAATARGPPARLDPRSLERVIASGGVPTALAAAMDRLSPFDWQTVERDTADDAPDANPGGAGDPARVRLRTFVRARAPVPAAAPAAVHLAALGFLSDLMFLYTSNLATGRPMADFAIQTTMNHAVWFHEPAVRVDDWLVCERNSSWGRHGRVLVHQRFWRCRDGRLVMSSVQEGLARLRRPSL